MKRFAKILYVAEFGVQQQAALDRAVALAENHQARLTLIGVWEALYPRPTAFPSEQWEVLRTARERDQLQQLEELATRARGRVETEVVARYGTAFIEVIREVLRGAHDLVIKPAAEDGLFASADMHLLRKCPAPVWLVRSPQAKPQRRILAAIDFDPAGETASEKALNRQILEMAAALAVSEFSELHVVHVWDAFAEGVLRTWGSDVSEATIAAYVEGERRSRHQRLEGVMQEMASWVGEEALAYLKPQVHLPRGNARRLLPTLARELSADLLVMGTVGRTGIPGLIIGNTAETVLHHIECSVLAVKPPDFVSPVTPA